MQQVNDVSNMVTPYMALTAPYLLLAVYAGLAILAIAVLAFLMRVFTGAGNGLLRFSSRLLIFVAFVFLIYLVVDVVAGTGVTDQFDFYQQPFWVFILILLVPGIVFRLIGALRPTLDRG